ncbi:hypothetical protein CDAR_316391 [Caerostris darwini]|uniref:Uncharacterized protein n=1 Tax=Caerostris darwini TaxID=1538125 RepID=A0AAV4UKS0_9ARAC|nr:hypothetical protein CDAR_316391 [Caerostris darwini]
MSLFAFWQTTSIGRRQTIFLASALLLGRRRDQCRTEDSTLPHYRPLLGHKKALFSYGQLLSCWGWSRTRSILPSQTTRVFFFPDPHQRTDSICRTKRNPFQSGSRLDAMMSRDGSPDQHPDSDRSAGLLTISPLSDAISPPRILSQIPPPFFLYVPFRFLADDLHWTPTDDIFSVFSSSSQAARSMLD